LLKQAILFTKYTFLLHGPFTAQCRICNMARFTAPIAVACLVLWTSDGSRNSMETEELDQPRMGPPLPRGRLFQAIPRFASRIATRAGASRVALARAARAVPVRNGGQMLGKMAQVGAIGGGIGVAASAGILDPVYASAQKLYPNLIKEVRNMNPLWDLALTQAETPESEEVSEEKEERRELPDYWNAAEVFEVGTDAFLFTGDFESDGQNSNMASAQREDGTNLVMKRPKYTADLWSDNLKKECYVARYLNSVGVGGVANCVAERTFSQEEVDKLQGRPSREKFNQNGGWHAIMLERVAGRSFMNTEISLGSRDKEKMAVRNMLKTAAEMLRSGVVNVDQYHNILFDGKTGDANFIDMEGASFLTEAPLKVARDAGEDLKSQEHLFVKQDKHGKHYRVQENPEDQVSSHKRGKMQAGRMMSYMFGLVPQHAFDEADQALSSRVKIGTEDWQIEIDAAIDQAWQDHKAWVKEKSRS